MEEAKALCSAIPHILSLPCPTDEEDHQDLCIMQDRRPAWFQHTLATHVYLPEADRKAFARTLHVANDEYDNDGEIHQDDIPEHSDECDPLTDAQIPHIV